MMRIGILTFHCVYNYGAVFQAYCTQKIVSEFFNETEIIDYRLKKQIDFTSMYSLRNGVKRFIKSLLLLPIHFCRYSRQKKFDKFINNNLKLSKRKYFDIGQLKETNLYYDLFIVGSDQVWNVNKKSEFSTAYFLDFVSRKKKKMSLASSIGDSSIQSLEKFEYLLSQFDFLSCREKKGADIIYKLTDKKVTVVLDPTLLVPPEYLECFLYTINDNYILYYSLDGYDHRSNNMDILKLLSNKFSLPVKLITPEWPFHSNIGKSVIDAGPEDFLSLIKNANLVCTNSFHGTALSIKFNVPFFVLENKDSSDVRKKNILEQLDLQSRIVSSIEDVYKINDYSLDYTIPNKKLHYLINIGYSYIKQSLL